MLATLEIKIKPKENIFLKRNYGSLFHGYLLSKIDSNYVEKLHNLKLNPYSQYFYFDKKENFYIWKISTLNKEAKEKIIDIMLNDTNETITFDYNKIKIGILSKEITSITNYKNIADKFFLSDETKRFANITFLTPTTYKVNKKFTFFPNLDNIFISIYNKWNAYGENISLEDSNIIEDISKNVNIVKYNLRSLKFSMEGVKIDSFIGNIVIYCSCNKMLANIYNTLLEFSKYAGIGAKTSISMGGVNIERN